MNAAASLDTLATDLRLVQSVYKVCKFWSREAMTLAVLYR